MKKASKQPSWARAADPATARRATRVPTSIDVKWGFADICDYAGTIINLTVLGCAMHNREGVEVRPGQVVFIRFWMPHERIMKVEVVHTALEGVQGFGARFLDLAEDDKETLEEMVQLFGEPETRQSNDKIELKPLVRRRGGRREATDEPGDTNLILISGYFFFGFPTCR